MRAGHRRLSSNNHLSSRLDIDPGCSLALEDVRTRVSGMFIYVMNIVVVVHQRRVGSSRAFRTRTGYRPVSSYRASVCACARRTFLPPSTTREAFAGLASCTFSCCLFPALQRNRIQCRAPRARLQSRALSRLPRRLPALHKVRQDSGHCRPIASC